VAEALLGAVIFDLGDDGARDLSRSSRGARGGMRQSGLQLGCREVAYPLGPQGLWRGKVCLEDALGSVSNITSTWRATPSSSEPPTSSSSSYSLQSSSYSLPSSSLPLPLPWLTHARTVDPRVND